MTLLEQIMADRKRARLLLAEEWTVVVDGPCPGWVEVVGPAFGVNGPTTATDLNGQDYVDRHRDARRIARVPQLEALVLEMAEALREFDAASGILFSKNANASDAIYLTRPEQEKADTSVPFDAFLNVRAILAKLNGETT